MTIIEQTPCIRHRCARCNSLYEVCKQDISVGLHQFGYVGHAGWHWKSFSAEWNCPACKEHVIAALYSSDIPSGWRKELLTAYGWTDDLLNQKNIEWSKAHDKAAYEAWLAEYRQWVALPYFKRRKTPKPYRNGAAYSYAYNNGLPL